MEFIPPDPRTDDTPLRSSDLAARAGRLGDPYEDDLEPPTSSADDGFGA
jgi:hypothetical protein